MVLTECLKAISTFLRLLAIDLHCLAFCEITIFKYTQKTSNTKGTAVFFTTYSTAYKIKIQVGMAIALVSINFFPIII